MFLSCWKTYLQPKAGLEADLFTLSFKIKVHIMSFLHLNTVACVRAVKQPHSTLVPVTCLTVESGFYKLKGCSLTDTNRMCPPVLCSNET